MLDARKTSSISHSLTPNIKQTLKPQHRRTEKGSGLIDSKMTSKNYNKKAQLQNGVMIQHKPKQMSSDLTFTKIKPLSKSPIGLIPVQKNQKGEKERKEVVKALNENTIKKLKSSIRMSPDKGQSAIKEIDNVPKKSLQFSSNNSNISLINDIITTKREINFNDCSSNGTGKKSKKSSSSLNVNSEQKQGDNNFTNQTFQSEVDVKKEDRKFSILDIGSSQPFNSPSTKKRNVFKQPCNKGLIKNLKCVSLKCLFIMASSK